MSVEPAPTASRQATVALGVLGRGPGGLIDGAGTLSVGGVVVECWIGAQDRWHRPADEVAVRQDRLDGAPVVQTALRIPGGDARMDAYGAVLEGTDWIVLEVDNASRTPFALAVVSRTAPPKAGGAAPDAGAAVAQWSLDGAVLRRDGQVLTVAARPADSWCGADTVEALAGLLGQAYDAADAALPTPIGPTTSSAVVAQVFAVSHGSALRVLIAPDDAGRPVPATAHPAAAPAAAAVARGWRRQLDAGTRCNLGDEAAETALLRRRADLLLDRSDAAADPTLISALVAFGHHEEAAGRLDRLLASLRAPLDAAEAAAVLLAAADVVDWSPDGVELASLLAGPAVELAGWAARSAASTPLPAEVGRWAVGRIAARAAASEGGSRSAPTGRRTSALGRETTPANGSAMSIGGFRARPGHDDAGALLVLRQSLVDDDLDGALELLGGWEADWRGRSLDVHALPTVAGPLSFALRWHGARPALLWQLEDGVAATVAAVELRCSRLDPSFRSTKRQGEALLAEPVAPISAGALRVAERDRALTLPAMAAPTAPKLRKALKGKAPTLDVERALWAAGDTIVVGIDEVGRGSWAGPLTIGAAVLPQGRRVHKIRDSKMLTEVEREALFDRIAGWCTAWSVGHVSAQECDDLGMSAAQKLAARRALDALGVTPDRVLIDGNWDFVGGGNTRRIIKGDATCLSIAAASILAKVSRDRIMRGEAVHFPGYDFELNKGYPCPRHKIALKAYGPTTIHRRSWVFMEGLPWSGIKRTPPVGTQHTLF